MTGRFHFRKSWGAEPIDEGWRFRIWAPAQDRMALRIGEAADAPMHAVGDGWFECDSPNARDGDGYAFVLPDGTAVNDPAARAQVAGVHGPSRLVDPLAYQWRTADWRGRPLEEIVFYELHTGTFTPEGSFDGVRQKLDHLETLGVTAIELMPVAQFGGNRGWGYDGVLLYAPHTAYGGPEGLKRLVDATHERGLTIFLDVVYNHFGPDGSYLHLHAPAFFHPEQRTPWGNAIAYEKRAVRDFFIENALYWLEEYRFDGLRLDAIDQIEYQSDEPLLEEIATTIRSRITDRHIHLTTEDDRNITRLHERDGEGRVKLFSAEWNDDFHHAAHALATGESIGYYCDYCETPVVQLAKALATGYIYQGEPSAHRDGRPRGESSAHLPPTAFVNFLQNHDQIGNRAYSERLHKLAGPEILDALTVILMLSPQLPLIFMGEEFGETRPFNFFTDFHGELGALVREGRRREFAKWPSFADPEHSALIADPNEESTFRASACDWEECSGEPQLARLAFVQRLLAIRQRDIVPLMKSIGGDAGSTVSLSAKAFSVSWRSGEDRGLSLFANLGDSSVVLTNAPAEGRLLFAPDEATGQAFLGGTLMPFTVISRVEDGANFVPLPG